MNAEFLLSPNRRRMVSKLNIGLIGIRQLRLLGWTDYEGPARSTVSPEPTRRGWVIPGTDPIIDNERAQITGTSALGIPRKIVEK